MKQRGGKRKGAGRKPLPDPKKPVTVYIRQSVLEVVPDHKDVAVNAIERRAKRI